MPTWFCPRWSSPDRCCPGSKTKDRSAKKHGLWGCNGIAYRERPGLEHLTRIACRVVDVELTRYAMFRIVHRSRNETSLLVTCAVVEPSVWLEALWDWLIQVPQLRAVFDKGKATSRRTC